MAQRLKIVFNRLLAVLDLHCCRGFSPVVGGGGGSLTAVVSLAVEHELRVHGLQSLRHMGSVVAAPGLQSTGSVALCTSLVAL